MSRHLFRARRIFDGESWHEGSLLAIEDGRVAGILPEGGDAGAADITDLGDRIIAPGFVDLQVNGGGGILFNNQPTVEGIRAICAAHMLLGSTAIFPTLITDTPEVTARAIAAAEEAARRNVPGFAGLHLEGPHLSVARKGAHDPVLIRPMTREDIDRLATARKALPALLTTVAPESVTPDQVRQLVGAGVLVSIGHSDAAFDEVKALADAGARLVTHLFNAQSQLGNREPGVVGAALSLGSLNASIIADGYHVHPATIGVALRAKQGPGRIFLVSDAMSPVGTDVAELELNGRTIYRAEGKLTLADGTLAGADLCMARAVQVMHRDIGIDAADALRMATGEPAAVAGLGNLGRLTPGAAADFLVLNDDLGVHAVYHAAAQISAAA